MAADQAGAEAVAAPAAAAANDSAIEAEAAVGQTGHMRTYESEVAAQSVAEAEAVAEAAAAAEVASGVAAEAETVAGGEGMSAPWIAQTYPSASQGLPQPPGHIKLE